MRTHLYDFCTTSVRDYAKAIGADYKLQTIPILKIKPNPFTTGRSKEAVDRLGYLPIFEKENAFDYFPEYDQIAIIDSDVWIRLGSPSIFNEIGDADFAGVVERDMPITNEYLRKIINYSQMQYSSIKNVNFDPNSKGYRFYNMGVMLMNKSIMKYLNGESAKQFLERPEFQPFVDGVGTWKWSTDQTLLNTWVVHSGMRHKGIDWKWNGLYSVNTRIKECHFVHFFLRDKLPERGENIKELMKNV